MTEGKGDLVMEILRWRTEVGAVRVEGVEY